jgi:hypothetical protein
MENQKMIKMIEKIIENSKQDITAEIKENTKDILLVKYRFVENEGTREEMKYFLSVELKINFNSLIQKVNYISEEPTGMEIILGVISHPLFNIQAIDFLKNHKYDELAELINKNRGAGLARNIGIV